MNKFSPIPVYRFEEQQLDPPVNIFTIEELRHNLDTCPIYRDSFYTVYLVVEGNEELSIDNFRQKVSTGYILSSMPGETWHWSGNTNLNGYCVAFSKDFILQYFRDEGFITQLSYITPNRKSPFMFADFNIFLRIKRLMENMYQDRQDSLIPVEVKKHLVRAELYQLLILLSRAEPVIVERKSDNLTIDNPHIGFFIDLVDSCFRTKHEVNFYAERMSMTPNYLNKIVRSMLGVSTKSYINGKIVNEACQLLEYTSLSVKEISTSVGFSELSYFIRFFNRNKGMTPVQYRESCKKGINHLRREESANV